MGATSGQNDRRGIGAQHRSTLRLLAGTGILLLAAACTPSPPPASQVPNPTRAQVVSASFGEQLEADRRDVAYLPGAMRGCGPGAATDEPCGGSQTLDVYRHDPDGAASRGSIVFVHGGGFTGGDKSQREAMDGPILAARSRGWDVVSVNYRLNRNGAAPWPAAIDDVEAAIGFVRTEGQRLGLATTRIVVAGHSAGGTLATLAGVAWNTGDHAYASVARVDGWVDISGATDFTIPATLSLGVTWAWSWDRAILTRMSPVTFLDSGDPPGYIIHGDADAIVTPAHAEALARIAQQRGARVQFDLVDAWSDLTWMPSWVRNHLPVGGANASALDSFLDGI
ncbi:MAG: alpha/beta hydrolase [Actinobacteria bacterium]|nr:alpha/beta hydrolase [Actinomycetota bacterium]